MIDLDETLDRARITVRSQINSVPVRPPADIARRHHRSRIYTITSGLAAIALLGFASSFILSGGSEFAAQPTETIPAHTYTIDLPGWDLVAVWEAEDGAGRSHTLFDDENSSQAELRRVKIDTGSAAIERFGTLQAQGIQPTETFSLYGSDVTMYLTEADSELGWARVIATWTGPQDEQVAVLFEGILLDEAQDLLTGLTPLDVSAWQSLTNAYEPPVTTTTGTG